MISLNELKALSEFRGYISAEEWAALLESCPEWVAQRQAREAAMKASRQKNLEEEAPLREDLRRIGFEVMSVWEFVNSKQNFYVGAIPTLIEHLQRPYGEVVREGIARSLAMKEARGAAGSAVVKVLAEGGLSQQLRWALANTLTTIADRSKTDAIKALLKIETNTAVIDRLKRALKTAARP
jgi:hypothetical protein